MRKFIFFLFLSLLLSVVIFLPEDLLNKNLLAIEESYNTSANHEQIDTRKEHTREDAYKEIYDALVNLDHEIYLSKNLTSDDIFEIREDVIRDNPEIFYLDYENSTYWSNGRLEFKYIDSKENILEKKAMINAKADYVLEQIVKPNMTELEKELAIHDYIVLNTKYDVANYNANTIPLNSYNVTGVLLDGIGVCEGYAKTFKLMLEKVGIESMIVEGPKINHAWNIVKIDGEYYHVDVTWNDPVPDRRGEVSHKFFNVSDRKLIQGEHIWDLLSYPKCSNEEYSYMWDD